MSVFIAAQFDPFFSFFGMGTFLFVFVSPFLVICFYFGFDEFLQMRNWLCICSTENGKKKNCYASSCPCFKYISFISI